MKPIRFLTVVLSGFLIFGACAPLRVPVIEKKAPIETFKYAYIRPTEEYTTSTGIAYGGPYVIYGSSTTKSVNPGDIIAGILISKGYCNIAGNQV